MTPTQTEQLRFALSQPRYARWPAPPVVPGSWRDLSGDLAFNTVVAICQWLEGERHIQNLAIDWSIDRVRMRALSCYEDAMLIELAGHAGFGRPGLINVIVHEEGMALLNGSSAIFHRLNEALPPSLETPAQRLDYLNLFMNWVHAEHGRFQPIGTEADLRARLRLEAAETLQPVPLSCFEESPAPENTGALAHYTGTVLYGDTLFRTVMALSPGGLVEMLDEEVLIADLPVREESLAGPMIITQI
ncbi:MAG: hypothetical protein CVT79_00500 [Alphaproteobacteria bacterium HGW-Alphaproteobacteria-18]|nr:MAG: hypothetical protein CVT79_00500 [Alphaproteobacteria bacterium HGW-Alphaproteobacteria-18]